MKSFCILQCVSWVICEFNPHKVWIIINGNQLIFFAHENWKSSLENCVMVVAGGIKTSFSIENFHISIKLLGNLFATAPGCIRSNYKEIFTFAVHQLMVAGWVSEWACGALIMFCKVINGSNSNSSVLILSSWMRVFIGWFACEWRKLSVRVCEFNFLSIVWRHSVCFSFWIAVGCL